MYGDRIMSPHRYDFEGISFTFQPEQTWKSHELLKSEVVKDWVYHLGGDERKYLNLDALVEFLKYTRKTPEILIHEAELSKKFDLDDLLKIFYEHLKKSSINEDQNINYYFAIRSFYVWNGFVEKLKTVPSEFKKVVATGVYDYDKITK